MGGKGNPAVARNRNDGRLVVTREASLRGGRESKGRHSSVRSRGGPRLVLARSRGAGLG